MPSKPKRPCSVPGCPNLVAKGRCEKHRASDTGGRGTRKARGYGEDWLRFRKRYLTAHPLCEDCEKTGRVVPATDLHHVVALRNGGERLSESNVMGLCASCHSKRTVRGE